MPKARAGWSWVFPILWVGYVLVNPSPLHLVEQFLWSTVFTTEQNALGMFQDVYFLLPLARSMRGFFCYLLWGLDWSPIDKSQNIVRAPLWLGPLEFLSLMVVHTKAPAIFQWQLKFSSPDPATCVSWRSVSPLVSLDSLYSLVCLSNLEVAFLLFSPLFYGFKKTLIFQSV